MDYLCEWEEIRRLVREGGFDLVIRHFSALSPSFQLYACSMDWYENPRYILKLRGKYGDIIVGWRGIHDYDYLMKRKMVI